MAARISAIVLDIEGTVCPIAFVKDTLFPYAVEKLPKVLEGVRFPIHQTPVAAENNKLVEQLQQFPQEYLQSKQALLDHVKDLTARDVKASYWKTLQGYLWKDGYVQGEIKAPIYDDAIANIERWATDRSKKVYIYSSGSVGAQKLLFAHVKGDRDLTPYLSGYFDTLNAGHKQEPSSYQKIAAAIDTPPDQILFLSDVHLETDAAKKAGWNVQLVTRPGNADLPMGYTSITSTDSINV